MASSITGLSRASTAPSQATGIRRYADTNNESSPEGAFNNLAWGGNPRVQEAKSPPRLFAVSRGWWQLSSRVRS